MIVCTKLRHSYKKVYNDCKPLVSSEKMIDMTTATKQEYEAKRKNNRSDVKEVVMRAIDQIGQGKARDFDEVCKRLEKKHTNA